MAKYPLLVECEAAAAVQIGADSRTLRNSLMQSLHARNLGKTCLRPSRKGVKQALDDLEERQIGIAYSLADEVLIALWITRQYALKPVEVLWDSLLPIMLCATQCFRFLLLVIEIGAQRMVRIVSFHDKVGDGELDLMDPKPFCRISWSQRVTVAEIEQDGGGLADHDISVLQKRRRKWRMRDVFSFQNRHQSAHASILTGRAAGDVDVVRTC